MSDKPRILITGATGFIGRHVAACLRDHAKLVFAQVDGARADLLDPVARATLAEAAQADTLVHLAWVTEHGAFWHSDQNAEWQAASIDLFQKCLDNGVRRIVGIGSCAEYDWTTGAARFREDAALKPHTPYGAAKVRTAEALSRLADAAGADWAWGRVFFSFGAGEPPGRLIPLMMKAVHQAEPLGIGPGDAERDFWPVETLGAAVAALALSETTGPVNLGSGAPMRFADLAAMIEALGGRRGVILPNSRPLGAGEPLVLAPDTARLERDIGFRVKPDLGAALARLYADLSAKGEPAH